MTAEEGNEESEPIESGTSSEHRRPSVLTREDMRLFVITATATVAANLLTVIIVGIAIAVARHNKDSIGTQIELSLGAIVIILFSIFALNNRMTIKGRRRGDGAWGFLIIGVIILIIYMLVWIGRAAGIHLSGWPAPVHCLDRVQRQPALDI